MTRVLLPWTQTAVDNKLICYARISICSFARGEEIGVVYSGLDLSNWICEFTSHETNICSTDGRRFASKEKAMAAADKKLIRLGWKLTDSKYSVMI
jgi:hypothetical protein